MGKPKKSTKKSDVDLEKTSYKTLTKDGKVKKKILKQFTPYQCKECEKKFPTKYGLTTHEQLHLNMQFPCSTCSYIGKTKKYLAAHVKKVHRAPKHECNVCGKAFSHPSTLKQHSMVHTGEKPHKCDVCGKAFRVTYSLSSHMLIHANEKPFKCSFCEYACRDNSTLRKHEQRHMGYVRMFKCKICPKKFETKPKLKYHIAQVHLNYLELDLKKHKCEHCGKAFQLKTQMMNHVEYMHDPSQVCPCPICGKTVKHKRYLPRHLRTHFPHRPHACAHPECGRRFKDKGDLKKHSIIHIPQLHLTCSKCGATCVRTEHLAKHMKTHEPREKSVICDYCNVSFYTKNYLIKHINQKHCTKKQRFICDYCGLVTYNKPSIVMHIKYGQCRDEELYCRICKYSTKYKSQYTLRNHYLRTHKMRYKPRKNKTKTRKPSVEVKIEPVDADPYQEVRVSLLDVVKEEIDIDQEDPNVENNLVSYSNHVLSEDLQEYLLKDEGESPETDTFDAFLMQHVFHKQVKQEMEDKTETDKHQEAIVTQKIKELIRKVKENETRKKLERKKKKQAKLLEKKLKREAKIMRAKKRREKYELERVRIMYNERMKRAVEEAMNKAKEPAKKITYFKKKTPEEAVDDKETNKNDVSDTIENANMCEVQDLDSNGHKDTINDSKKTNANSSDEMIDLSNNNINLSSDKDIGTDITTENSVHVLTNNENIKDDKLNDIDMETEATNENHEFTNDQNGAITNIEANSNNENSAVKEKYTNNEINCTNNNDISTNDKQNCTNDDINGENSAENCTKVNDKEICTNDTQNKERCVRNSRKKYTNDSNDDDDDSNNDSSDDDNPNLDSDYQPDSEDETVPNKKMNFKTFQCYICFKLFPTKEDQLTHCSTHFDICSTTTLSKCPVCGHVTSKNLESHMKKNHDMDVTIPHNKITRRDDEGGSKYCFKLDNAVVEIIPSVKRLNHLAAVEIDKKKRQIKDLTVAKTKLVKKGSEWMLEKVKVDASSYQQLPEFTNEELGKLPVSANYTERLGQLGRLARAKGLRMMFPCDRCDKICQNFAALRLHERRHDPDKKPFAPKIWKRKCQPPVSKEKPKVTNLDNRFAKPQPIKNKHKCDEGLKKFYETHIRGADIEFWQFLKIYNKMDRENIRDFKDLEGRVDFGIHTNDMLVDNDPKTGDGDSKNDESNSKVDACNSGDKSKSKVSKRNSNFNSSKTDESNSNNSARNNGNSKVDKRKSKFNKGNKSKTDECNSNNDKSNSKVDESNSTGNKIRTSGNIVTKPLSKTIRQSIGSAKTNVTAKKRNCDDRLGKVSSKLGQQSGKIQKPYKRVIMISKKQQIEREKVKMMFREKLKGNI